jgi:hypothetical protein
VGVSPGNAGPQPPDLVERITCPRMRPLLVVAHKRKILPIEEA